MDPHLDIQCDPLDHPPGEENRILPKFKYKSSKIGLFSYTLGRGVNRCTS